MTDFRLAVVGETIKAGMLIKGGGLAGPMTLPFDFTVAPSSGIVVEVVEEVWEDISEDPENPSAGRLNDVLGDFYRTEVGVLQRTPFNDGTTFQLVCYLDQVETFEEVENV